MQTLIAPCQALQLRPSGLAEEGELIYFLLSYSLANFVISETGFRDYVIDNLAVSMAYMETGQ